MKRFVEKVFLKLNITWPKVIVFAIAMGVFTALMAMWAPDGSSFHDIAVTPEWWVLPAMLIITNSKRPIDAALKTFVFFLISQPLVYLVQVPFNGLGWGLFSYYGYWFMMTLLTFPAAFLVWYIKKDKWYSGLIMALVTGFLAVTGFLQAKEMIMHFPNHLLTVIYCFGMIPILIMVLLREKWPRIISAGLSVVALVIAVATIGIEEPYEIYNDTLIQDNDIVLVGEPEISSFVGSKNGDIEIIRRGEFYTFKLNGMKSGKYTFVISDDENNYEFEYYFDKDRQMVVVNRK